VAYVDAGCGRGRLTEEAAATVVGGVGIAVTVAIVCVAVAAVIVVEAGVVVVATTVA
jgi:hypothetical protein